MTHAQKWVVVVACVTIAVVLHASFFEWSYSPPFERPLFVPIDPFCWPWTLGCLGIWYDHEAGQNRMLAVLIGVVTPLILMFVGAYIAAPLVKPR